MFSFSYSSMSDWYEKERDNEQYFDPDADVVAYAVLPTGKYERYSEKLLKKKGLPALEKTKGYKEAFVKQNIKAEHIRKLKFIENKRLYPFGMYVIKQNSQNIFFVFPNVKKARLVKGQSIFVADHLSFPYKPDDTQQVHLHYTYYTPSETDTNVGTISHIPECHFADGTLMPSSGYDTDVFDSMGPFKRDILDICRACSVYAGGGKPAPSLKHVKKVKKAKAKKPAGISNRLAKVLLSKGIRGMYAFGILHEGRWHFTCVFDRTVDEGSSRDCFVVADGKGFAGVQKTLSSFLENQGPVFEYDSDKPYDSD